MIETVERRSPWPTRVAVGILAVWLVGLLAAARWGSDETKCAMAVFFSWSGEKTERICAQAYPDTWRKEATS